MSEIQYPHPVLLPDGFDYEDTCSFSTVLDGGAQMISGDEIVLTVGYSLECDGLKSMIESGDASVGLIIHSPQASYRKTQHFGIDSQTCLVRINKFDVIDKLEIQCYVLAAKDIKRFALPEFNQVLFSGVGYDLRKGDILAISEKNTIYLDSSELEKPLTSIFVINCKETQEKPILPDFEDDTGKIAINLSGSLFRSYEDIEKGYSYCAQRCITCAVVFPVLVEAIGLLRGANNEDYSDQRWARVVTHKLEEMGIDLGDCADSNVMLANELLGDVIGGSMNELTNLLWSNSETDEESGGYD